ncbi:fucolectin-like [Phyllobates terribilis]|uniref:fucolectin-like n=1 Tax=Phyllobates terribilis TaxID=111132 RepID=UPI003CCB4044
MYSECPGITTLTYRPPSSLILLGSVVLALGCAPAPVATNIARTRVASQVSDYPYATRSILAKNAIDGNKDTDFSSGFCTHTNLEKDPWWKLDLGQSYKISSVAITNRMDCGLERLMGAEVRIGNSPDNNIPVCGTVTNVVSATMPFCCKGMEGRYVSVVIPGHSEYLSMCEVEVYSDSN